MATVVRICMKQTTFENQTGFNTIQCRLHQARITFLLMVMFQHLLHLKGDEVTFKTL